MNKQFVSEFFWNNQRLWVKASKNSGRNEKDKIYRITDHWDPETELCQLDVRHNRWAFLDDVCLASAQRLFAICTLKRIPFKEEPPCSMHEGITNT
jgi:hypothetical protein